MSLAGYNTAELLAELQRREREEREAPPFQPCACCTRYKATGDYSKNPCTRGHVMRFDMPKEWNWPQGDTWGYTRDHCEDRDIPDASD